jgi:ribosome-associated protein
MAKIEETDTKLLVNKIIEGIQEKKGADITVLDLTEIDNTITSFFVICAGDSNVHVEAVADSVEDYARKHINEKPFCVEGKQNAQWILLDYFDVVVHLFQRPAREFYNLEALWADAKRTDIPNIF